MWGRPRAICRRCGLRRTAPQPDHPLGTEKHRARYAGPAHRRHALFAQSRVHRRHHRHGRRADPGLAGRLPGRPGGQRHPHHQRLGHHHPCPGGVGGPRLLCAHDRYDRRWPSSWRLFAWPGPTRIVRSQVLTLRERGYVRMAMLSGATSLEIMFVEMMPNMLPWLAASFTGTVSATILGATALEVLGLGPTRVPSLGHDHQPGHGRVGAAARHDLVVVPADPHADDHLHQLLPDHGRPG